MTRVNPSLSAFVTIPPMANFWNSLPIPFTVLAPMDDVTDVVFREIMTILPPPDVFFTEFASVDGLMSPGREAVMRKLRRTDNQHPVIAQIWGTNPDNFFEVAKLIQELGFDGIDINMGCPVEPVVKHGAGSGLITNPTQAKLVIEATRKGAPNLPLSIKTRLGFDKIVTEEWTTFLLQQNLDALSIHGRIAVQMSKGDADWNEIGKVVKIRDSVAPQTKIIGNGDIKEYAQVLKMHEQYNVDGVMIGRGVFQNPWVFAKTLTPITHQPQEFVDILRKHLDLFIKTWGKDKNFEIMKKFFKMYVKEFEGANALRQQLMECKKREEVDEVLKLFAQSK